MSINTAEQTPADTIVRRASGRHSDYVRNAAAPFATARGHLFRAVLRRDRVDVLPRTLAPPRRGRPPYHHPHKAWDALFPEARSGPLCRAAPGASVRCQPPPLNRRITRRPPPSLASAPAALRDVRYAEKPLVKGRFHRDAGWKESDLGS